MLVDSHCHLNFPEFQEDLDAVVARAHDVGVTTFLTINTRLTEVPDLIKLTQRFPNVYCSVGVHPHEAQDYVGEGLVAEIERLARQPKVVGIGETGLDYYYDNSPRMAQMDSFRANIAAAKSLNLPLIIHTRDADDDTIQALKGQGVRGVFHCFSGGLELAKSALELGFYISFSGIITFKKADELRDVVKYVPLECMLVETDAPFLAPVPHRGKRNEPAFVRITAEQVAFLKGVSFENVAQQTTTNFFQLFDQAKVA